MRVIVTSMAVLAVGCAGFALGSEGSSYLWFIAPMALLGAGMIVGTTARAGLILSRMPTELPGLANALNLAALELGAILGQTVMTVMLLRFASEDYEGRLTEGGLESNEVESVVEEFRVAIGSINPGGSTEIAPQQVEGLLPGFREAMAAGLSVSLWLVTLITIAATVASILLFRWAAGTPNQGRTDA